MSESAVLYTDDVAVFSAQSTKQNNTGTQSWPQSNKGAIYDGLKEFKTMILSQILSVQALFS